MSEVEEIEARVSQLPDDAFAEFREWFHEIENERWDQQIRFVRFLEALSRSSRGHSNAGR